MVYLWVKTEEPITQSQQGVEQQAAEKIAGTWTALLSYLKLLAECQHGKIAYESCNLETDGGGMCGFGKATAIKSRQIKEGIFFTEIEGSGLGKKK